MPNDRSLDIGDIKSDTIIKVFVGDGVDSMLDDVQREWGLKHNLGLDTNPNIYSLDNDNSPDGSFSA